MSPMASGSSETCAWPRKRSVRRWWHSGSSERGEGIEACFPGRAACLDELIAERSAHRPGETPADMRPWMRAVVSRIDVMNFWVGRIACFLLLPVMGAMVFEVASRSIEG